MEALEFSAPESKAQIIYLHNIYLIPLERYAMNSFQFPLLQGKKKSRKHKFMRPID